MTQANPVASAIIGRNRAWTVVVILALLSLMSFLDRQILAILVTDLRSDLNVSDTQIGWLLGPVFFAVYMLTLVTASALVDRHNRKTMIVAGAWIWGTLTIASAFAETFLQLLWLRGGVAFGEALLGPAAISLIGDLFDRDDRPLPTAVYIIGSTVGSTGSAAIGAAALQLANALGASDIYAITLEPWRLTLILVGLPSMILACLLLLAGREPVRGGTETTCMKHQISLAAHLRERGRFYLSAFGGLSLLLMNMASVGLWGPTFLVRAFAFTPVESGYWIGGVSLAGGVAGAIFLPALIRRLLRRERHVRMHSLVLLTMIGASAAAAFGGLASTPLLAVSGFGIFMFLAGAAGTMPTLIVQLYVPAHLRGRASAAVFFILYLLAFGLAPTLVPYFAARIFNGAEATGHAIALVAIISGVAGSAFFSLIRKDFRTEELRARGKPA